MKFMDKYCMIVKNKYVYCNETYEKVIFYEDDNCGFIISIHNTVLGPALGGCRMINGVDKEVATEIVCNMAKTMTYKNCIAGLKYGGGKGFIYKYKEDERNKALITFSEVLNELGGIYLTADDVGTNINDMEFMRSYTLFAHGIGYENGQIPATSIGVLYSIEVFAEKVLKKPLSQCSVAIQGIGKVGFPLACFLSECGVKLYINEIDKNRINQLKKITEFEELEKFISAKVDILAPCALGGVLDKNNVRLVKAKGIVGGANNMLCSSELDRQLWEKGVWVIPDFISNCGGVIDVDCEGPNYGYEYVTKRLEYIKQLVAEYIEKSITDNKTMMELAVSDVDRLIYLEE